MTQQPERRLSRQTLEEVNRIYFEALTKISQEFGRQSPEMRVARKALKDATYIRMADPGEGDVSLEDDLQARSIYR